MNLLPHVIVIPTALDLLAIIACIGLLATDAWVVPHTMQGAEMLHDGIWRLLGLMLAGLSLMSVISLLLRAREMSGLPWEKALSVLPLVLSGTHYGMTWFVRITAVGVLWFGWWWGRKRSSRLLTYAMLSAVACVVWSVSASSHSADWGDFTLPEWMGWLHIMAGSMWLGGILTFVLVIQRRLRGQSERTQALFAACASGLSRLAGIALILVLMTGAYNVWRQMNHLSDLWSSRYGWIVLSKIAFVCVMATIGAINRYFNLPFLCREAGVPLPGWGKVEWRLRILRQWHPSWRPREGDALARQFGCYVRAEAWLVLGVLVCAALLGHAMPPKKHVDAVRHVMLQDSGTHTVFQHENGLT